MEHTRDYVTPESVEPGVGPTMLGTATDEEFSPDKWLAAVRSENENAEQYSVGGARAFGFLFNVAALSHQEPELNLTWYVYGCHTWEQVVAFQDLWLSNPWTVGTIVRRHYF